MREQLDKENVRLIKESGEKENTNQREWKEGHIADTYFVWQNCRKQLRMKWTHGQNGW